MTRGLWILMTGALVLTLLLAGLPVQAQPAPGVLDVMFLFDLSGSMAGRDSQPTAAAVKDSLSNMGGLDVRFGVASFVDYPDYVNSIIPHGPGLVMGITYGLGASGDYAWSLDQDLTADTALVNSVITGLAFFGGADWPQDIARALLDTAAKPDPAGALPSPLVSWRANATKVIIMFCDNTPHGNQTAPPTGVTWGEDPGRDGIGATAADNLDMDFVLGELFDNEFEVVTVDYSSGDPDIAPGTGFVTDDAAWWMRQAATGTHGAWFPTGGGPALGFAHQIERFIADKVPMPVGWTVFPVSKVGVLAPWLGLAAIAVIAAALVRRRTA